VTINLLSPEIFVIIRPLTPVSHYSVAEF
jgi:hypothetical protein